MVEEQNARIEQAMTKMIDDIDKTHIRQLQAKMFRCAANCCDDKETSITTNQRCIENCGAQLQAAQKFVQSEINMLQDRLQRCIMTCNDTIRDKMGVDAKDSEISRYTKEFESCATKCVDTHINLLPNTTKKIRDMLSKNEFQS